MKKFTHFSIVLLLSCVSLNAKSLRQALIEVNQFWAFNQAAHSPELNQDCQLPADQAISLHLELVQRILSERDVSHLSPSQQQRRAESLEHLAEYATRQLFPINLTHRNRQPVFIDHRGVHCAVGYLISAGGSPQLSERISANMNTHYLMEMDDQKLFEWVAQSGFTLEELAWIQPGYPFATNWGSLKGGMNGPVFSVATYPSGEVYAGGRFDTAGGGYNKNASQWISGVAGFDWLPFSNLGTDGDVQKIIVHNSDIYMAGRFSFYDTVYTGSGVVKLDGSQAEGLGSFYIGGIQNYVNDLAIYRDTLYAGGYFRSESAAPVLFGGVAKWNGMAWVQAFDDAIMPAMIPGEVRSLHVHNNMLVVGGDFQLADSAQTRNIFAIDGNTPVFFDEDLPVPVNALADYQGKLYAGTRYMDPTMSDTAGLVYYDNQKWEIAFNFYDANGQSEIFALQETPLGLIVGGDFEYTFGNFAINIAAYRKPNTAQPGYLQSLGILDSTVLTLAYHNDMLYAGGYFNEAFNSPAIKLGHIAALKLSDVLTQPEYSQASLSLYPNPARDFILLELPADKTLAEISVVNAMGQPMNFESELASEGIKISTQKFTPGWYLIRVKLQGFYHTTTFLVEP